MIIDGQRIQGIFLYNAGSESVKFTKNDLVVSGDSIYICDAESSSGIDPAEDTSYEYFRPYPGSKIISASEFFQYVENVKKAGTEEGVAGGDKYISAQSIIGILQGYQFGLGMEGVIEDWINKDGDTTLSLSSLLDRPLDNLMLTETLNRGIIKVSHELNQIVDGSINGVPFSTIFGFLSKTDPITGEPIDYQLLLSQYTYKSSDTLWIRLQEMMSPLTGVSVYRYMSWSDGNFPSDGSTISSWRNVFSYSSAIQSKLDTLQEYYNTLSDQFRSRVRALEGSYRFREVGTTDLSSGVYTVCVKQRQPSEGLLDNIYKTESITVRLDGTNYTVLLNNLGGSISVTPNSISASSGLEIIDVYGRQEFVL